MALKVVEKLFEGTGETFEDFTYTISMLLWMCEPIPNDQLTGPLTQKIFVPKTGTTHTLVLCLADFRQLLVQIRECPEIMALRQAHQRNLDNDVVDNEEAMKSFVCDQFYHHAFSWLLHSKEKRVIIDPEIHDNSSLEEELIGMYVSAFFKALVEIRPSEMPLCGFTPVTKTSLKRKPTGEPIEEKRYREDTAALRPAFTPYFTGEIPVQIKSFVLIQDGESTLVYDQSVYLQIGYRLTIDYSAIVYEGETYTLQKSRPTLNTFVSNSDPNKQILGLAVSGPAVKMFSDHSPLARMFCSECRTAELHDYCESCNQFQLYIQNVLSVLQ